MKIQCRACCEVTDKDDWRETEVSCDDCGSHLAMACPKCGDVVDLTFRDLEDFMVKDPHDGKS